MIRRRMIQLLAGLAIVAAGVAPARADEIRLVTTGVVTTTGFDSADAFLSGSNFTISGHFTEGIGDALTCRPCAPGETIPLHSRWAGDINGANQFAIVDGGTPTSVFLGGDINFDGGSAVVPNTSADLLILQRPFNLAPGSFVTGFSDSARTMPLFSFGLGGNGTVFLTAQRNGDVFESPRLQWVFNSSQVAPTPEPASVLLMLTGLGGAFAAARRRKNQQ